jgi:hypothetical protein
MKTTSSKKNNVKCLLGVMTVLVIILAMPALAAEDQETAPTADLGVTTGADSGNKLEWSFGGTFQSDVRFRVQEKSVGLETINQQTQKTIFIKNFYIDKDFYRRVLSTGVERNQNLLQVKFKATYGQYTGVADIDFAWLGYSGEISGLPGLSDISQVDPYYLKVHSLYFQASDFLVNGLDLRVGQQTILWGVGDQFNPTNTINPNDLEDILLFGSQLGNMMVRVDYMPISNWTISGVLVPIFKPALVPRSASLGLAAVDRYPMLDGDLRDALRIQQYFAANANAEYATFRFGPTVVTGVDPVLPERSFNNMPFEFRVAGAIFKQDIALSYYRGFSDMPVFLKEYTRQISEQPCQGGVDDSMCLKNALPSTVSLTYPRMEVFGINAAGEINPLGWISEKISPLGYRLEVAVVVPQKQNVKLYQDTIAINGATVKAAGYYKFNGEEEFTIIKSTPFLKWVVGLDYTFNDHFYLNIQWVHGLTDEFGAGDFINSGLIVRKGGVSRKVQENPNVLLACAINTGSPCAEGSQYTEETLRQRIGDYVVLGLDFKFADDKGLVRLFTILEVTGYFSEYWSDTDNKRVRKFLSPFGAGFSAIVYPEFNYNFGNGLDIGFGALMQLGSDFTKFGDPAAGGSLIWTRGRYRF